MFSLRSNYIYAPCTVRKLLASSSKDKSLAVAY